MRRARLGRDRHHFRGSLRVPPRAPCLSRVREARRARRASRQRLVDGARPARLLGRPPPARSWRPTSPSSAAGRPPQPRHRPSTTATWSRPARAPPRRRLGARRHRRRRAPDRGWHYRTRPPARRRASRGRCPQGPLARQRRLRGVLRQAKRRDWSGWTAEFKELGTSAGTRRRLLNRVRYDPPTLSSRKSIPVRFSRRCLWHPRNSRVGYRREEWHRRAPPERSTSTACTRTTRARQVHHPGPDAIFCAIDDNVCPGVPDEQMPEKLVLRPGEGPPTPTTDRPRTPSWWSKCTA